MMTCSSINRRRLLSLVLLVSTLAVVSAAECVLCPLDDDAPPQLESVVESTDECTKLVFDAKETYGNSTECLAIQHKAMQQCNCTPWPCPICQDDGAPMEFPDRLVYRTEEEPISCGELQTLVSNNTEGCTEDMTKYRFYCGCPESRNDDSCGLCLGEATRFPNLVLPLAPDYIPKDAYTCGEVERQRSLLDTCEDTDTYDDIATLCGCKLPKEQNVSCTTLCPDGSLIPERYMNETALLNQPTFGTMTCGEYQLLIAEGLFYPRDCKAAHYVGLKHCGCQNDTTEKPHCDICEDGSAVHVETLSRRISYKATCLDWAGDAFGFDADAPVCSAYQASAGVYCDCDNPLASRFACRVCDSRGGKVVPNPNLTIIIDGYAADCGELEFAGNNPMGNYTCSMVRHELGVQCCEDAPSAAPSVSPPPTFADTPEFGSTLAPTTIQQQQVVDPVTIAPTPIMDAPEIPVTKQPSSSTKTIVGAFGNLFVSMLVFGWLALDGLQ